MTKERLNLSNPLHVQQEKLEQVRAGHIARLRESGILQKAQRAYVAEYMPIPSGGSASLDISESLHQDMFAVSHDKDGDREHILIVQGEYHPILVGTVTASDSNESKIEANQKRGFNVPDVRSVASMVAELVELKQTGELPDLTNDLQRIEKQDPELPKPQQELPRKIVQVSQALPQEIIKTKIDLEEAIRLLSYSDVLPEQHQKDATDAIRSGESTIEYAKELVNLYATYGKQKVEELAYGMVDFCAKVLKEKNILPTMYATSISWALWDITKQSYLAKHPEKSSPEYINSLTDPFSLNPQGDQKRMEIRERHVGWEIMRRWDQGEVRAADIPIEAQRILTQGKRNETGQLRSFELAKLGHLVSQATPAVVK